MPIQSADLKLLRSEVMADTTDGGGPMTGVEIIDGQSNNIFPDTSEMDRAQGRAQIRKVFGVAHTDDTDTLLGAHALITRAPADPLVSVALFQVNKWAARRFEAKDAIERYMTKGLRLSPHLMEIHYAGSRQIRLVAFQGEPFPSAGEVIVLRQGAISPTAEANEQYVRITKTTVAEQSIAVDENGQITVYKARVATCELVQELAYDFEGPVPKRVVVGEGGYAQVFSAVPATGAKFYGIKSLQTAVSIGDRSLQVAGGIYTSVVPAASIESPVIDLSPISERAALSRTAIATLTLPSISVSIVPGKVLHTPTPMEPRSLAMSVGATTFTDDGAGNLKQGTAVVGTVDYRNKSITFAGTTPAYSGTLTLSYKPAVANSSPTHSDEQTVTLTNQGLSWVRAFEPAPAPGSLSISYMAQGRWYDLFDNGDGKMVGADSSYGTGALNYSTGSVGFTLGAVPDVGSSILFAWGNAASGQALANSPPLRLTAKHTGHMLPYTGVTVSWSRGGTNYSATTNASGTLTGAAQGAIDGGFLSFAPDVFPDGQVTISYPKAASLASTATANGSGSYTLPNAPITPGSVAFNLVVLPLGDGYAFTNSAYVSDDGSGKLTMDNNGTAREVGTVNYSTGALQIASSAPMTVSKKVVRNFTPVSGSATQFYDAWELVNNHVVSFSDTHLQLGGGLAGIQSTSGTATPETITFTPVWKLALPLAYAGQLLPESVAFGLGGAIYTSSGNTLRMGWNADTNAPTLASAGTVSGDGVVQVNLPASTSNNSITWYNAATALAGGQIGQGVFRIPSAPLKPGSFQLQSGTLVGTGNDAGDIVGNGFAGHIDYQRGIVRWNRNGAFAVGGSYADWRQLQPVTATSLSYNAVSVQYLPLDASLIGLDTARLPIDGKVPIFRAGGLVVVHNTLSTALTNPIVKGSAYSLGRARIAAIRIKDSLGATLDASLYTADLDAGTVTIPVTSNISTFTQPFTVSHRIEDLLLVAEADISGRLKFTRSLTHNFPASTSYVSSALAQGDKQARAYNIFEQTSFGATWKDELMGTAPIAQFNSSIHPITVTNRGAITERWVVIFTSSTAFRVLGEESGQVATGDINTVCAPNNPGTNVPYFSIPPAGWGGGWSSGNALRFNTEACGSPIHIVRVVLQGPYTNLSDSFELAQRGDVNRVV